MRMDRREGGRVRGGTLLLYMAPFDGTKNSFSKKVTFEYTHAYSSTIGDVSDLCTNG